MLNPKNKICPLLSASDPDSLAYCLGERCAWWKTVYDPLTGESVPGSCALVSIAATLRERQV